jgi:hypothetical protein
MLSLLLATLVTLSPRLGIAPVRIAIRAAIEKPSESWYCPSVELTWSDGTRSFRESDCEPFEDLPEHYYWSERFERVLGPGAHHFEVRLKQGATVELYRLDMEVSGGDD